MLSFMGGSRLLFSMPNLRERTNEAAAVADFFTQGGELSDSFRQLAYGIDSFRS